VQTKKYQTLAVIPNVANVNYLLYKVQSIYHFILTRGMEDSPCPCFNLYPALSIAIINYYV
jgi:hypothetical protein